MQDRQRFMPSLPPCRARAFQDNCRSTSRLEMPKWGSPFPNGDYSPPVPFSCSPIGAPAKSPNRGGVLRTTVDKRLFSFPSVEAITEDRGSLSIEGSKTGEEVLIEQTAPRQKKDSPSEDLSSLKRKLAQTKGEVRELTSKLRKAKSDLDKSRALASCLLNEMTERREKELKFLYDREDTVHKEMSASFLNTNNTMKTLLELQDKALALQKELTERTTVYSAEKLKWEKMVEEDDTKTKNDALEKLKGRVKELEELLDSERSRFSFEKQTLVGEKSGTELLLQQSYEKIRNLEVLRAEEEFILAQARQFVKNVCQPGFAVVKDSSLEPVEKNREYPTGYVLVPLIVLLHGYTLLPSDDREKVIQEYEDRATWLE